MEKSDLGDRMKRYEQGSDLYLMRRTPVIIRVDGKAFHTLTKGMERPFDQKMTNCMWAAATALCKSLQGAKVAYTQSDEISVLLVDYETINSEAPFDYRLQKLCSIAGSIATSAFTSYYLDVFPDRVPLFRSGKLVPLFDARCFNVPREDVVNYFVWRQQDAQRNSVSMLAQAHFSHKELQGNSCELMKIKLFQEKEIEWNKCQPAQQRGACISKFYYETEEGAVRSQWNIDKDIPIFTENRDYISRHVEEPYAS